MAEYSLRMIILNFSGCLCGVVANMLIGNITGSEFELQSRYNVHFPTNTQIKGMYNLLPQLWVQ